jgi:CIC family chloride channel protein
MRFVMLQYWGLRDRLKDLSAARGTAMPLVLAVITGVGGGLGAVVFRELIDGFDALFFTTIADLLGFMGRFYVLLLPALGGLAVGPLTYFFAREAKGHGVPEVMLAISEVGGRLRARVVVIGALASAICIGSGGSVGREGPIVLIGSSLASSIGQRLKLDEETLRLMVAAGSAAGISATFNAPIAGVFFALEVILRRFNARNFSVVVLSSVLAKMVSVPFLGDEPAFAVPAYRLGSAWEIVFYAPLGILAGVAALIFIALLYRSEDFFDNLRLPEYVKPALGGLGMGAVGLWYANLFGVGYPTVSTALAGQLTLVTLVALAGLKIFATSLTLGSGGSGGVFSPSLFIGAMLGGAFGDVVHNVFPDVTAPSGAYALVGMGAVFAAAARAPITSIIVLFEMTQDYHIILPLMTAVVISTVVAQVVSRETIYTVKLVRRGVDVQQEERPFMMEGVTVAEAMNVEPATVPADMKIRSLAAHLARAGAWGAPVLDEEKRLVGVVTVADVQRRMESAGEDSRAIDIATRRVDILYPDQTLHRVMSRPTAWEHHLFPVVDREDPSRLVGVLQRSDVIRAYSRLTDRADERRGEEQRQRLRAVAEDSDTRMMTFDVDGTSPWMGTKLRDISLPSESVVVAIRRRGHTVIPRGEVVLREGDRLVILARVRAQTAVAETLRGALIADSQDRS